jgi:N-sulfoglucosamine sulfohydrolase
MKYSQILFLFVLLTTIGFHDACLLASRPNILLIVSEDNGPELGCYGDPYARTPNLDRLASEGVRFNRAFVAQAGCSQSRAAYLTGLYPHQNGQLGLATWTFRMYREDIPNIPRSLKAAGYRTGIIGKLHVNPEEAFPFDMHEIRSANFARENLEDYAKYAEAYFVADERPFFLSVNYPDAHGPWLKQVDGLPKDPLGPYDVKAFAYLGIDPLPMREAIANHYNCMSRLDSLVGDLLASLERSGKAENTLVVYFGDHGADFLRGKRTSYEGGVRVPLIVRWPKQAKSGQVREELVSTVDLMPTLLAVAQAEPVNGLPGRSLLPLLRDEPADWREYLFTEFHTHAAGANFYPQRTVRDDRYKLIENLMPGEVNPGYGFTNARFEGVPRAIEAAPPEVREAYQRMHRPPRFELYDLQTDPYEFRNLVDSDEHAAVFEDLKQRLSAWRRQTRDPLLDSANLERLTAEVKSIGSKKAAKKHTWGYPDYFFGKEPKPKPVPNSPPDERGPSAAGRSTFRSKVAPTGTNPPSRRLHST